MRIFNNVLHSLWRIAAAIAFIFVAYVNIFIWGYMPLLDFEFQWKNDIDLLVFYLPDDAMAATVLQEGDIIYAIEGKRVRPNHAIAKRRQPYYTLLIQRANQELEVAVPAPTKVSFYLFSQLLPATILSLSCLGGATAILKGRRPNDDTALHIGYGFLMTSVVVMGIQGYVLGMPYAWLGSAPFVYVNAITICYIAFLPRQRPLNSVVREMLKCGYLISIALGVIAVIENLFLLPHFQTVFAAVGFSPYKAGLLFSGIALVVYVVVILKRTYEQNQNDVKSQLQILRLFLLLAVLPATALSFLPTVLIRRAIIPFPISITLLALLPLGYVFAIYRRHSLGIDIAFGRITIALISLLLLLTCYSILLAVLKGWFPLSDNALIAISLAAVPVWIISLLLKTSLTEIVERTLYGDIRFVENTLPQIATHLASKPELTTLDLVVATLAENLDVETAVLVVNDQNMMKPVTSINANWMTDTVDNFVPFSSGLIRSMQPQDSLAHPLLKTYPWIEMLLPMQIAGEQIGFLAMSRPKNKFFNVKHLLVMEKAADILAVGSQSILLFDAARRLSLELMSSQENERMNVRSQLHDNTIQSLSHILTGLHQMGAGVGGSEEFQSKLSAGADALHETILDLRAICHDLVPMTVNYGLQAIAWELSEQFQEKHDLEIILQLELNQHRTYSRQELRVVHRVLLEALNNVVKHANVRFARVTMRSSEAEFTLCVEDGGAGGVSHKLAPNYLIRCGHIGLLSMQDWAASIGGTLCIDELQPSGTRITLEVPIKK